MLQFVVCADLVRLKKVKIKDDNVKREKDGLNVCVKTGQICLISSDFFRKFNSRADKDNIPGSIGAVEGLCNTLRCHHQSNLAPTGAPASASYLSDYLSRTKLLDCVQSPQL